VKVIEAARTNEFPRLDREWDRFRPLSLTHCAVVDGQIYPLLTNTEENGGRCMSS